MLAIRLQRTGRSGHAQFRVIVQDSRFSPKRGRVVSYLGNYDPHTKTAVIDSEKAAQYLQNGAQPSDRVARLLQKEGIKLPDWVKLDEPKKRTVRNPEKRRSTTPPQEAAETAPTGQAAQPEAPAAEAAAEPPAAEEPKAETEAGAEPPEAPTAETPDEAPAQETKPADEPAAEDSASSTEEPKAEEKPAES